MTHMIFRTVWWKRAWQNHRAGEPASDIHHDVSHITHTHFSQVLKVLKENTITDTETCSCYISSHLIPIPELCVSADITAVYDSSCVDVQWVVVGLAQVKPFETWTNTENSRQLDPPLRGSPTHGALLGRTGPYQGSSTPVPTFQTVPETFSDGGISIRTVQMFSG